MKSLTSTMTVRLACVPEQVNIPVSMVKALHLDDKYNVDLQVLSVPEGTGKMLTMLETGEADIAMTVSDAFIVANAKGRPVELVGTWVSSPLIWAVAASPALPASVTTVAGLYAHRQRVTGEASPKLRVGISRPGSGSQTMASYMAMTRGLLGVELDFVVAHDFVGLKKGIADDLFDVFLWETFTTKPDFDANVLRKIDDVCTPWPAFSLVMSSASASSPFLRSAVERGLFPALAEAATLFVADANVAASQIVREFGHKEADARLWLSSVEYTAQTVNAGEAAVAMDEDKACSPCDSDDEGLLVANGRHFRLATIDTAVYAESVRILQTVGLVAPTYALDSLWPSSLPTLPLAGDAPASSFAAPRVFA